MRNWRYTEAELLREDPDFPASDPDENYSVEHTLALGSGDGWRVALTALEYHGAGEAGPTSPDVWVADCAIETAEQASAMIVALHALVAAIAELQVARVLV